VSFNLKPGVALGDAVAEVQEVAARTLPATMSTSFTGTAKAFQSSLTNLGLLLTVAILVVYIVLGVLYESYIHPLTLLSGLRSADVVRIWLRRRGPPPSGSGRSRRPRVLPGRDAVSHTGRVHVPGRNDRRLEPEEAAGPAAEARARRIVDRLSLPEDLVRLE